MTMAGMGTNSLHPDSGGAGALPLESVAAPLRSMLNPSRVTFVILVLPMPGPVLRALMGEVGTAGGGEKERGAPIGRGRAGDMAVNCVLPVLYVLGGSRGRGELAERCLEMYRAYPRLQENELTREMARQLVLLLLEASGAHRSAGRKGYGSVVGNARRQQGLHHLQRLASSPVASPIWT